MKTSFSAAPAGLCLLAASGLPAIETPAARQRAGPAGAATVPAAHLLREWPATVPLGFDTNGRLVLYDQGCRIFEAVDLNAPDPVTLRWNQAPDDGPVVSGALSLDGRVLAAVSDEGGRQGRIRLWNALTGERLAPEFAPSDVAHMAFSPDGKSLAGVVAQDGAVRLWDAGTGELRWSQPLPEPMQTTWTGIRFSPDGRFLAARNSFGFSLWDVAAQQVTGTLTGGGERILYLDVSPDLKRAYGAIMGARPGGMETTLLDLNDPARPRPVTRPPAGDLMSTMETGAFSADGRFLAILAQDKSLRVWDGVADTLSRPVPLAVGQVTGLAISPDARIVATLERDPAQRGVLRGSVRLWDVASGRPASPPRPVPGMFWDWQFDPDSRHLVVSSVQGNDAFGIQIWRLPPATRAPAETPKPAASAEGPSLLPDDVRPDGVREDDAYARDAFRLFALLEGWPGRDRVETRRVLAEDFLEPLRGRLPAGVLGRLAGEFASRISTLAEERAAAVCRDHFTHDELRGLIGFYETPLGRKYARVHPQLVQQMLTPDPRRDALAKEISGRARQLDPSLTFDLARQPKAR